MDLEPKRIETMKKYSIFTIIGFPCFTMAFLISFLLFTLNLIGFWIILVEFGVAIPCWILSSYFGYKLKNIDKEIDCN